MYTDDCVYMCRFGGSAPLTTSSRPTNPPWPQSILSSPLYRISLSLRTRTFGLDGEAKRPSFPLSLCLRPKMTSTLTTTGRERSRRGLAHRRIGGVENLWDVRELVRGMRMEEWLGRSWCRGWMGWSRNLGKSLELRASVEGLLLSYRLDRLVRFLCQCFLALLVFGLVMGI